MLRSIGVGAGRNASQRTDAKENATMPRRMELSRILIHELKDHQLIELREVEGHRTFPIMIGLPEAQAIERRMKGQRVKRPQTHELLASVIESLGGELESVTICDLSEHTFFATLDIRLQSNGEAGELQHIDARPSDAIALGIASDAPIYCEEHVLDGAQPDAH